MTRPRILPRRAAGPAGAVRAALAGAAVLVLASCSGGAIAANTPGGSGFVSGSYSSTYYKPGSRPAAPAVGGKTLTGSRFALAADLGNVVVLNFWGSWCAPCRREAPALAALATHFKGAPVRFVGDDCQGVDDRHSAGYRVLCDTVGLDAGVHRSVFRCGL